MVIARRTALPQRVQGFGWLKTRLNLEALREVFTHLCSPSYEAQGRRSLLLKKYKQDFEEEIRVLRIEELGEKAMNKYALMFTLLHPCISFAQSGRWVNFIAINHTKGFPQPMETTCRRSNRSVLSFL